MSQNYYDVLGVTKDATDDEIVKKYRKLTRELHPDRNAKNGLDTTDQFSKINKAYEVLSDPLERFEYDESLEMKNKPNGQNTADIFSKYNMTSSFEDFDKIFNVEFPKIFGKNFSDQFNKK